MKDYMIGHTWKEAKGVCPAILACSEVRGKYPGGINRVNVANWVMDYEFTPHGRCRAGSPHRPWERREAGTVHLYPPRLTFWENTRGARGVRHSAWMFFTGGAQAGLGRFTGNPFRYAKLVDAAGEFGRIFHEVAVVGQQKREDGFWEAQELLFRAIRLFLSARKAEDGAYRLEGAGKGSSPKNLAQRVEEHIRNNLGSGLTLDAIASALNVSVSQLTHRYRREAGSSPMATYNQMRIEQAKMLLMKGMPLKAIAGQLGFSDAFHLSKTFKKVEGLCPRRFLKSGIGGDLRPGRQRFSA